MPPQFCDGGLFGGDTRSRRSLEDDLSDRRSVRQCYRRNRLGSDIEEMRRGPVCELFFPENAKDTCRWHDRNSGYKH
jgi:hypothetical protein